MNPHVGDLLFRKTSMKRLVKPDPLKPGDSVAIAAPSACLTKEGREYLGRALSILESLGFHIKATSDPFRENYYLAGDDRERAEELMALFADSDIRAIFCARGGYGSQRIIPFLDANVIRKNPKIFVGSSDMTALLIYFLEQCGLVPFHGPNVATRQFLEGDSKSTQASLGQTLTFGFPGEIPLCKPLKAGMGKGKIKGGCLSLLVTTIGTDYEIDPEGAILFIEDANEPLYRIDRMLTHMRQAGKLEGIQGLILGEMVDCGDSEGVDLETVILDLFHDLEIPIVLGFPSGHGRKNLTIPLGVEVTVDGSGGRVIFDESGLSIP